MRCGDDESRDSIVAVLVRRRVAWVSACCVSASICARRRKRSCKRGISPYRPGLIMSTCKSGEDKGGLRSTKVDDMICSVVLHDSGNGLSSVEFHVFFRDESHYNR